MGEDHIPSPSSATRSARATQALPEAVVADDQKQVQEQEYTQSRSTFSDSVQAQLQGATRANLPVNEMLT
jgi:hypothetical protein